MYLLAIFGVSHQQFRGSVPASGHIVSVDPFLSRQCHGPGKAKVTQLDHASLRDEYVLWFDVTVDDLRREQGIKKFKECSILKLPQEAIMEALSDLRRND